MSNQDLEQGRKPAREVAKSTLDLVKTILIAAPLVAVVVIVVLALIGPTTGNIFSNIVASL